MDNQDAPLRFRRHAQRLRALVIAPLEKRRAQMTPLPASLLTALERARFAFGPGQGAAKLALLAQLVHAQLPTARAVLRLHEALCFIRAYPDDARVLARVERMLAHFSRRADLRAHRAELADSGISGTTIHYRFFAAQAQWLARRWPANLQLDRDDSGAGERIARALPVLLMPAEAEALRELKLRGYTAIDRLRPRYETDAVFLLRCIAAMPGDDCTRQAFGDAIDASFTVRPGLDTPARTHAKFSGAQIVYRRTPPRRDRPELRAEITRAPRRLRRLSLRHGQEIVDLARGAMAVRERALEAFSYADARDAWLADDGDGLAFAFSGVIPERRQTIAAVYGGLTLRNGVPIGYLQADIVGRAAALSFNTFDTFRGSEAAFTFARLLAALHGAFGTTSFSIEPYQLGRDNDEGIASGAWWFYYKLGFRPRDGATRALVRTELQRLRRDARYRSRFATLRALAQRHLFFDLDPARAGPPPLSPQLGLRMGQELTRRSGADRERALDECAKDALRRVGLASLRGFSPAQRAAWHRWAPLLVMLDLQRWTTGERSALIDIVRAKGARSEREFVALYAAHPRLDAAVRRLAAKPR